MNLLDWLLGKPQLSDRERAYVCYEQALYNADKKVAALGKAVDKSKPATTSKK